MRFDRSITLQAGARSKPVLRCYVSLSEDNMKKIEKIIKFIEGLGIKHINFNRLVIPRIKF